MGVRWGDVLGGDFVLRGPNPFLKVIKLSCVDITWLSHVVQMGPVVCQDYLLIKFPVGQRDVAVQDRTGLDGFGLAAALFDGSDHAISTVGQSSTEVRFTF